MRKKGIKRRKEDFDIVETINVIGEEVEEVLASRKKEKYFEEVILLYSLIENVLKWSVFVKVFWEKSGQKGPSVEEFDRLRGFCRRSSFRNALNVGLCVKLINFKLYKRIEEVIDERNDVVHQLWIYEHRSNARVLRKTLEILVKVARELAGVVSRLTNKIGVEEIYEIEL